MRTNATHNSNTSSNNSNSQNGNTTQSKLQTTANTSHMPTQYQLSVNTGHFRKQIVIVITLQNADILCVSYLVKLTDATFYKSSNYDER